MATYRKRGDRWHVQIRTPCLTRSFDRKIDADHWVRKTERLIDTGELFSDDPGVLRAIKLKVLLVLRLKFINLTDQKEKANHMIERVDHVVRFIALLFGGIFLLALTLVTVLDVTLRSGFNSPILGGRDIAQFFLIIVVSASIAYSARSGGQVVVELFGENLNATLKKWIDILMKFIGFVMLLILAWHLSVSGFDAVEFGEASGTLQISYGPFMQISAFGMLLYAIVLLVELLMLMRGQNIKYAGD